MGKALQLRLELRFSSGVVSTMGGGGGSPASSSGEEDGDAERRAAIDSIAAAAAAGLGVPSSIGPTMARSDSKPNDSLDEMPQQGSQKPSLKLYQIKAKKILDDLLEKNLDIVRTPGPHVSENGESDAGGIKLFRRAPPGLTMDKPDRSPVQHKKPRILPGEEINEKSKKFRRQIISITVDGKDIIESAKKECRKSLARFEAKEAELKAKSEREKERVLELKKIRGEMWLPSIAKEILEETRRN